MSSRAARKPRWHARAGIASKELLLAHPRLPSPASSAVVSLWRLHCDMSKAEAASPVDKKEASDEQRTMHVFLSKALHKILREAPKKHTQLRTACSEVIGTPA